MHSMFWQTPYQVPFFPTVLTTVRRQVVAENLLSSLKLWMNFLGALTKFTKNLSEQTQLLENEKNRESENMDKEETPKNLAVVENCKDGTRPGEENVPQQRSRKRKRHRKEG